MSEKHSSDLEQTEFSSGETIGEPMGKMVEAPFIEGQTCYRCGADKKDISRKGYEYECSVYGKFYGNHMWKPRQIDS